MAWSPRTRRWALAGHGIVYKARLDVAEDIRAGRLVPLLGRSVLSRAAYSFVTTSHPSPAMQLVRDWLGDEAQRFCGERAQVLPEPQDAR